MEIKVPKIAFVVVRYGEGINGGAEAHCRMLAERLCMHYNVEVLTTCVENYVNGENVFPEGTENINGVLVRRFMSNPVRTARSSGKFTPNLRSIRAFLYRKHLLASIANLIPVWNWWKDKEIQLYQRDVFYSPTLFEYIHKHKDEYDVFIPFTIDFPMVYYTALYAPEKTLVIPTMHYQKAAFRPLLTEVFTRVAYIGFNTRSEEELAENIFGSHIAPHGIISVGTEIYPPADWETTRTKYNLPDEYLLFVGRIDKDKLDNIFGDFLLYKQKYPESKLKLVLVGGLFVEAFRHPDIIYTGFVDEGEKTAIIEHAKIILNPSQNESLSLILLEALSLKKVMIANGKCNVMREHYQKSNHAIRIYFSQEDFVLQLQELDISEQLREDMGEKGFVYVSENYSWPIILGRLKKQIEIICETNKKRL